ncbi:MAG: hypothetical protein A2275_12855 [Bacteroidetes bacterium RIFOXYA12_FULL_35_11]|nr:MAG: hypothetical protein A2X01_05705 [Bacteroidetes bacterium GWF2_35_48]OFY72601.1 MAG: hypothetical protein A2275_12855 [Bacteroidetes bacterium RIFOXYA12_FULL_35_11]HBX52546.1 hypothetical protein [Bacteroidales bacterium]
MPNLNGTGPEKEGSGTGRKLGKCKKEDLKNETGNNSTLGKGMGEKRKSGRGKGKGKGKEKGKGKRLKTDRR